MDIRYQSSDQVPMIAAGFIPAYRPGVVFLI
jgi:hypothetical protein